MHLNIMNRSGNNEPPNKVHRGGNAPIFSSKPSSGRGPTRDMPDSDSSASDQFLEHSSRQGMALRSASHQPTPKSASLSGPGIVLRSSSKKPSSETPISISSNVGDVEPTVMVSVRLCLDMKKSRQGKPAFGASWFIKDPIFLSQASDLTNLDYLKVLLYGRFHLSGCNRVESVFG